MKSYLVIACLVLLARNLSAEPAAARPQLQVINGSGQPVDVFWLKSADERVPHGPVAPGKDLVISTTLGHAFAAVGRDDKSERIVTSEVPIQAMRFDPPDPDGIPAFYTQRVTAGGLPIVASAQVNPYALKEAAYLVDLMLANRPDVRAAMIKSGSRLCILARDEFTTDQPEWKWLAEEPVPGFNGISTRDYRDARARGMGGSLTDPFCSCGEENLLGYEGDPYSTENILIHELAHNIHLRGMSNVDPSFDNRVKAAYDAAMKAGLWRGKYPSVNHHEYFAEGVQSWFDNNRENDHDHNHVNTRAELLEYDPGLAALCREVFGDTVLKYTKPATRLTGHLAGYDPASAPKFAWPERLQEAKRQIRAAAQERDRAVNAVDGRERREIAGFQLQISRQLLAESEKQATESALELMRSQLERIVQLVPEAALVELRKVPLYVSPPYAGTQPKAEYHPDRAWLTANKRDPMMAKAVEFTNTREFADDCRRMPVLVLHELAHAYHDRVLGTDHAGIKAAYEAAKASGKYDRVERQDSHGRRRVDRAYALTNPQEYFAESTEAYFAENDFFPFNRGELKQFDPKMFAELEKVWGLPRQAATGQ
jgi:hypothetical protein